MCSPECTASPSRSIVSAATASSWRDDWRPVAFARQRGDIGMFSTVLLFKDAMYGALIIALACSVLGVYVVLRRIVFVGAALAEISSAGIALALWLSGRGFGGGGTPHPPAVTPPPLLV